MLPSLFSGISGLKVNQKKLDIVGNNIANSSTTAFKSQRARFEDMISQSVSQATGANVNTGGVNGKQVGLGVQLAGIDTVTSTGSMQPTSRNLDFAIDGSGYFVVGSGQLPTDSNTTAATGVIDVDPTLHTMTATNSVTTNYTRDGSFTLDTQGNLITSDGLRVYGFPNSNLTVTYNTDVTQPHTATITTANAQGGADMSVGSDSMVPLVIPDAVTDASGVSQRIQSFSVGKDGVITGILSSGSTAALGQIAMSSFKNDAGLSKSGKNLYSVSANSGAPVVRAKFGDTTNDNSKGYGDMLQGMLEMSNVDLAEQFTDMIIASRAFQANGKTISTGDEILQDLVNLKR